MKHPRKENGKYFHADKCEIGKQPFIYKIWIQTLPVADNYPSCFGIVNADGEVVAWLTETQVRNALEEFDALA